mgnify:FL=1
MGDGASDLFTCIIGAKKCLPLSITFFSSYFDVLKEMANKFIKEGIKEVLYHWECIVMILVYSDNKVLFANTLEDAQKNYYRLGKLLHVTSSNSSN